ncbi:uncharacterized protein LOC129958678 [Argiope bruennichi]|uniref:Uncharacterized protein n=1 Tax=Argiope bruennichi TaxID=94029 RepID=A0A8T0F647_ARGBR|nr:uncharacterized protein LOC129958678 [Argiope bruennichi]XP_055927296.1 uncharacterized protein LOC129958678 [Argiope bruennichi]KAF8784503.1 hypothetical protein HNY73_010171 [Argiope bruennichi]
MASAYLPVETILKVDESELLLAENVKLEQPIPLPSTNYVSIGTQCDWEIESPDSKSYDLPPLNDKNDAGMAVVSSDNILLGEKNANEVAMVMKGWPSHSESNQSPDPKMLLPTHFSQQFSCNIQPLPIDEKFFLQFDYKTRNKLKTKQRRMDPYYRSQERVRQRTVMRLKRQDPRFRAAEREKGRYRMRLKRLDPVFRSQERERQRERMKLKRSDPGFREREREQQKSRLHVKRLDPSFKTKDDQIRLCIKRQNNGSYSTVDVDKNKTNPNISLVAENQASKHSLDPVDVDNPVEMRNTQAVFPENINSKLLSLKPKESVLESFHFKKQQILNFNFYNSTKEQWASHDELCSKTIADFNVSHETETHKQEPVEGDAINVLQGDISTISKKLTVKEEVQSENIINIKSEELSGLEPQEQKNSDEDSAVVLGYSLPLCTGK